MRDAEEYCKECGAWVTFPGMHRHREWHAEIEARLAKLEAPKPPSRRRTGGRIPIPSVLPADLDAATVRVASILASAERQGSKWWADFGHENPSLRREVQEWTRGMKDKLESFDPDLRKPASEE